MNPRTNALKLFRLASRHIPAYKSFLQEQGIHSERVKKVEDIPFTDKQSYFQKHEIWDFFDARKRIPPVVYASSGSSGSPTFWFRGNEQEEAGGEAHETILKNIFSIRKEEKTLVAICFSMGVWIAGGYTLASFRYLSQKGYQITSVTPGIEREDILTVLQKLAPRFDKLVLAGYPPFLVDVIAEAIRRKIPIPKSTKVLTAGDKFSEKWRDDFMRLAGLGDPYHTLVSVYGSADAGFMGYETPASIFVRRAALEHKALGGEIFGQYATIPALLQYDPQRTFFEEVDGELVLTTNTCSPLIRYNIHDTGRIIPYEEMHGILKKHKLLSQATTHEFGKWQMPFLVQKGRTDVAVTFYALNIPPEHIQKASQKLPKILSGNFFAYTKDLNKSTRQSLYCAFEVRKGVKETKKIQEMVQKALLDALLQHNIEFRKLYNTIGHKALPTIILIPHGEFLSRRPHHAKGVLNMAGKKPKIAS